MYAADGCGLAAPQIGVLRRIVVLDVGDGLVELINPKIIATEGEQCESEGCLSVPGEWGITRRPAKVIVKALDRHGNEIIVEGEGLLARAFCHEIDHLDGKLFIDVVIEKESK
jgi:peptide deformylase